MTVENNEPKVKYIAPYTVAIGENFSLNLSKYISDIENDTFTSLVFFNDGAFVNTVTFENNILSGQFNDEILVTVD